MSLTVSVIMPCFNCAPYIEQALRSVFEQRGDFAVQLVIADGGSSDGTCDLLAGLEREAVDNGMEMVWLSEQDRGQSDALNKTLSMATGDVITWLNGDDWYAPGAFDAAIEGFAEPDTQVVLGDCIQMGVDGPLKGVHERSFVDNPANLTPFTGGVEWSLVTPEVFFRRELISNFRYDLALDYFMDVDLWMHLFLSCPKVVKIERTLAFFRSHEECKTIRAWKHFLPRLLMEDHVLWCRYRDRMDDIVSEEKFRGLMRHFFKNWKQTDAYDANMDRLRAEVKACQLFTAEDRDLFWRVCGDAVAALDEGE